MAFKKLDPEKQRQHAEETARLLARDKDLQAAVGRCLTHAAEMTERELGFVRSVASQLSFKTLTPRQEAWLLDLGKRFPAA